MKKLTKVSWKYIIFNNDRLEKFLNSETTLKSSLYRHFVHILETFLVLSVFLFYFTITVLLWKFKYLSAFKVKSIKIFLLQEHYLHQNDHFSITTLLIGDLNKNSVYHDNQLDKTKVLVILIYFKFFVMPKNLQTMFEDFQTIWNPKISLCCQPIYYPSTQYLEKISYSTS